MTWDEFKAIVDHEIQKNGKDGSITIFSIHMEDLPRHVRLVEASFNVGSDQFILVVEGD